MKLLKHVTFSALSITGIFALSAQSAEVDTERSLFIRDVPILERFSMNDTLQKLLQSIGDVGNTPQSLLDTWPISSSAGCDSTEFINGFSAGCGRNLGDVNDYRTLALVNRFDLAPEDGANCGEYRIAFSVSFGGNASASESFVIFESRLPNPNPQSGLEGCRPIAEFWADLSLVHDMEARASRLHSFYFDGLPGFSAVLDANNYRGEENGSGQIRFNQRFETASISWMFFEFKTEPQAGNLVIKRSTLKDAPDITVLNETADANVVAMYQDSVIEGLSVPGKKLLANSVMTLSYDEPDAANHALMSGSVSPTSIGLDMQSSFASAIQNQLNIVGASITPTQVMARVNVLTCIGCHNHDGDLGGPISFNSADQGLEMLSSDMELAEEIHIEAESFSEQFGVQTEVTEDFDGGLNVGWLDAGDWMIYDRPLPTSFDNRYLVSFRYSAMTDGVLVLERPGGAQAWLTQALPATGGWQTWRTVFATVNIPQGEQGIAIAVQQAGWNLNYFNIEPLGGEKMVLKPVLRDQILPERKQILETFLDSTACSSPSCIDSDNDGVTDDVDQCANTPLGTVVNAVGCPVQTGGSCDGVAVYPNWSTEDYAGGPKTHHEAGDEMQDQGKLYQANWYTSSLPGSDASWTFISVCE